MASAHGSTVSILFSIVFCAYRRVRKEVYASFSSTCVMPDSSSPDFDVCLPIHNHILSVVQIQSIFVCRHISKKVYVSGKTLAVKSRIKSTRTIESQAFLRTIFAYLYSKNPEPDGSGSPVVFGYAAQPAASRNALIRSARALADSGIPIWTRQSSPESCGSPIS